MRNVYLDTVKGWLILLVVVGHLVEPAIEKCIFLKYIYVAIYFFHMPMFVLLSGYFSNPYTPMKTVVCNNINRILLPFLFFQLFFCLILFFVTGDFPNIFIPYWYMWYMLCLFGWRICLPFLIKIPFSLPCVLSLALVCGFYDKIGPIGGLSKFFAFMPFFLFGFYLKNNGKFEAGKLFSRQISWIIILVFCILVISLTPSLDVRWLHNTYSYHQLGHSEWKFFLLRLFFIVISLVVGLAFLSVLPLSNFMLKIGRRTVYIYLLHGFLVRAIEYFSFYEHTSCAVITLTCIPITCFIMVFLSSQFVVNKSRFLVEGRQFSGNR